MNCEQPITYIYYLLSDDCGGVGLKIKRQYFLYIFDTASQIGVAEIK
jgi:hypothetical protein